MIEIPLEALAFIFSAGTVGGWIAGKVFDAMHKTTVRGFKAVFNPDVEKIKDFLYGINKGGLAPSNGINRWPSMDDSKICFGETSIGGYPAPPYDLTGLREVAQLLPGGWESFIRQDDRTIVNTNSNLLFIGGKINDKLETVRNSLPIDLPLDFLSVHQIPSKYRPENLPERIVRYFTDNNNKSYSKESYTNNFLVDKIDSGRPPFGPFIGSDGQLESDVILLSVVPAPNGKRAILVQPGHGAGSMMADLLFKSDILEGIYKSLYKEPYPWFQAAFLVPVKYERYHEIYDTPQLMHVVPLGSI